MLAYTWKTSPVQWRVLAYVWNKPDRIRKKVLINLWPEEGCDGAETMVIKD